MSEIKGQLLGIILTVMVFGAISVVIANVYNKTAGKAQLYSMHIEENSADELGYDIPTTPSGLLPNASFPSELLSY